MKIVFVAGPYRGKGEPGERERYLKQSVRFQAALARSGIVAYSPNLHDAHWLELEGDAVRTLGRFTDWVFEVATAVAVMPGWEDSTGTKREIATATARGIPIFYLRDEHDLAELKAWYNEKELPGV